MNKFKIARTTSTDVTWRDEIAWSHDVKSEGFERLKEAINLAKSSTAAAQSAKAAKQCA
jgi:hypothetical protein